ncbi:MAG: hypothetical protein KDA25_01260 [Phycisphaerales bacterium]|nr:hypothetical protein [Phycisphaerales bacterium]
MTPLRATLLLVLVMLGSTRTVVAADDARTLLRDAEVAMGEERYVDACAAWDAARAALPLDAALPYNMAVARFRQGRFADAASLFGEAAAMARDPGASADAYFNRGNAALQDGLTRLPPGGAPPTNPADLDAAAERFDAAKADFRRVLAADPTDEDARHNAELAHRKRQLVEELRKALPQQPPSESQPPSQEQPQEQDQNQPRDADPQGSDQRHGPDTPPPGDESPPDQPQAGGESSDPPPDGAPSSPPKDDAAPGDDPSSAPPQDGAQEDGAQDDSQPKSEQAALPQEGPSKDEHGGDGKPTPRRMSRDEAERLLQGVRDKERQRRQLLSTREKTPRTPVDKDW